MAANINDLQKIIDNDDSFIKNIFFFELLSDSKCKCKKNHKFSNFIFSLNIDPLPNKSKEQITIENILKDLKMNFMCENYKNPFTSKFKFNLCPKILIILFEKQINNNNFKYIYDEHLSIKDFNKKDVKYELISIIKNKALKKDKNDQVETFFKSPINKTWHKCNEKNDKIEKDILFKNLNNQKNNFPILLIYQKIE